jgi:hypothetical protein
MEKVKARFILEAMGKPPKIVEKALKQAIAEIKKDGRGVEREKYSKVEKVGKVLYSSFVEFEIICKNLADLWGAVMDYMPVNVEIISPDKLDIDISDLQDIVNDLTARMHNLDKQIKVLQASNIMLQRQQKKETTKK